MDGKRLGNGDPNTLNSNPAADIDQIPEVMIERVDVVTGGASATYGSDAMAGVVNFILRGNFQGVEVDAQYGFNQHCNHDTYMQQQGLVGINGPTGSTTNGYRRDLSPVLGTNTPDGNGNVTGYFPWPQPGQSPPPTFNSSAYGYLQRQDTRYQGGFLSHYDINDHKSPGNFDLNIGRRNIEGGGRSSLFDHTNCRVVGEATGEIIDGAQGNRDAAQC